MGHSLSIVAAGDAGPGEHSDLGLSPSMLVRRGCLRLAACSLPCHSPIPLPVGGLFTCRQVSKFHWTPYVYLCLALCLFPSLHT